VIGPYKLLEQIGEGSVAVVFAAEQVMPVRRKVALKILKPQVDDRQVVARFEAERQCLALMDHPSIVTIHDAGSIDSGRPYFVMELVNGLPITEYCDDQCLTVQQRLELFVQLCRAMAHVHQKGVIYRDLKPADVLVTTEHPPVVKLIDFGRAKAMGLPLTDKTLFTGFVQMIGTPAYMSPEQTGQVGMDVETCSDVYSLGALLYELLTGTIQNEQPPKPSTRLARARNLPDLAASRGTAPSALVALVQGQLDAIVMKCLEKERDLRYDSAGALADELESVLTRQAASCWRCSGTSQP
jgi:eukaryotic-like serine/threonine-protein kinase